MLLSVAAASVPVLSVGTFEIVKRLLCAMLIGGIIGVEREYAHRPAGMRTDMMVCVGACAVMITSQQIFAQYNVYGATPDPARLGAQVISGVGFLGAGTILHEGLSVRGLTTAASLWVVACLGLAAGGGYYVVALTGAVCIFLTLTVFKRLQEKLLDNHNALYVCTAQCDDISTFMNTISVVGQRFRATTGNMQVTHNEDKGIYEVSFRIEFAGSNSQKRKQNFMEEICKFPSVIEIRFECEFDSRRYS